MTARKKILFIIPAMRGGGAEKVLLDVLENIDYSAYDITLLMKVRDEVHTQTIPPSVRQLWLWEKQSLFSFRMRRITRTLGCYVSCFEYACKRKISKVLGNGKFDTIISFMEGEAVKIHHLIADRASNNVSWVHIDMYQKHWTSLWFRKGEEKTIYEQMDKVVFVSNDAKRAFIKEFDYKKDNPVVIYNLINKKKIKSSVGNWTEIEKSEFTICMVGRLNEQKRFDRAIEALANLKSEGYNVNLWIVGDGELKRDLEDLAVVKGVSEYIKFLGFVNPPYPYMKAADLYLSVSSSEGYPLTLCEALCLEKPCVSTKVAGPMELLDDSKFGLLCTENVEDISIAIKKMIDNSAIRNNYAEMARQRSEIFDIENTMSQIYEVI